MPYPQTAETAATEPNISEGDKKVSTKTNTGGWKTIVLEITVLLAMFIIAATFALLPTAYGLWRHF